MDKQRFFSKLCIVLFTCLLIFLFYAKDAISANWTYYFTSAEQMLSFYNADRIQVLPNNIIRVWVKNYPKNDESRLRYIQNWKKSNPKFPEDFFKLTILFDVNCTSKSFSPLEVIFYDKEGKILNSVSIPTSDIKHTNIAQDSNMDALQKIICPKNDLKKKGR